jgi:hypothetical protein
MYLFRFLCMYLYGREKLFKNLIEACHVRFVFMNLHVGRVIITWEPCWFYFLDTVQNHFVSSACYLLNHLACTIQLSLGILLHMAISANVAWKSVTEFCFWQKNVPKLFYKFSLAIYYPLLLMYFIRAFWNSLIPAEMGSFTLWFGNHWIDCYSFWSMLDILQYLYYWNAFLPYIYYSLQLYEHVDLSCMWIYCWDIFLHYV